MKGLETDMARYWGEKTFNKWLDSGKKSRIYCFGIPSYNIKRELEGSRSAWLLAVPVFMAFPWAINHLFGYFQFITGDFVTDSLILSLIIGAVALWIFIRRRSSRKDAEEIAARYSAPEKDS